LLVALTCLGQEVEICSSFNTSSEQRFQNGYGVGIQYQHGISSKWKVGLGVHFNFRNVHYTDIPYIDAVPFPPSIKKVYSKSQRYSIRVNIQGLLINKDNLSLSLGPEISYNYFKGKDNVNLFLGGGTQWINYSQPNGLTREIGLGLISKLEIKNFTKPRLSLCLTARPELTTDGVFAKGGQPVFSGILGFFEFQVGLKYRFKK